MSSESLLGRFTYVERVVDEIASVELDLWASEQGLEKIQRNLCLPKTSYARFA